MSFGITHEGHGGAKCAAARYLQYRLLQALYKASQLGHIYGSFLKIIAGLVFLRTPLKGTSVASLAQWVASLHGIWGKETSTTILQSPQSSESSLDAAIQVFAKQTMSRQIRVHCFYETRGTNVANAVFPRALGKVFGKVMVVKAV